jgi:hypothetical protein
VYDGTRSSGQWSSWLGTTTTNVVQVDLQTLNFLGINFTTNATLQIGNRPDGTRGFSDGQIADLRIYRGICSSNNMEAIRTLSNGFVDDGSGNDNTAPRLQAQPASGSNHKGGSRTFSVSATGLTPLSYQWKSNNVPIPGATNTSLTLTNIQLSANGANFVCTITNGLGSTNSATATLAVVATVPGSYAEAVVTNKPFGYWHFNETTNGVADVVSPLRILDYMNGNDGVAGQPTNTVFDFGGLDSPSYPGFSTTNAGIRSVANGRLSQLNLPAISTYTNGMTICGWIYTVGSPASHGIFYSQFAGDGGNTVGHGYGLWFNGLDPAGSGGGLLGFEWNNSNLLFSPSGDRNVVVPTNEWTFVALTIDPTGSNATLYAGSHSLGFEISVNDTNVTADSFIPTAGNGFITVLGRAPYGFAEDNANAFLGINMAVNDMAVFYSALSPQTLTNLYVTGAGAIVPTLTGVADPNAPGNLLLTWGFGTLQEASEVTGPYTDVSGPPTSPYSVPMTDDRKFYRAKY